MLAFIDRLATTSVASLGQLQGCTPDEIQFLEQKYGVRLPESYALFLGLMGQGAGQLVDRNEFDLYYPKVLRLTEEERQFWADVREEDPATTVIEFSTVDMEIHGCRGSRAGRFAADTWG
jgi:hypothetical protein